MNENPFNWKWLVGLVVVIVIFAASCSYVNTKLGLEDENPFEEAVEVVINTAGEVIVKKVTGLDIDLDMDITPNSPED